MLFSRTPCPFAAGPRIDDPRCFAGRREELGILARRMSGSQPISVNVVGARRIGKSSLLWHFCQTWEQRVAAPARFAVLYADVQQDDPPTEDAFFRLLASTLLARPALRQDSQLAAALSASPFTRHEFAAVLDLLAAAGVLPVFCLDEFEQLLKRPEHFGDPFFDHLRGFMNASRLMLIIASREPVDVYAKERRLTSAFFNLGHLLPLGEFSGEEAEELLLLPDPAAPALAEDERLLARNWGGRHPYLLQLAAQSLFDAQQAGKDTAWAKRRFKAERQRIRKERIWTKPLSAKVIAQGGRNFLTALAEDAEKCKKVLLALVPLAVLAGLVYALLTGKMPAKDVLDLLMKLIPGK